MSRAIIDTREEPPRERDEPLGVLDLIFRRLRPGFGLNPRREELAVCASSACGRHFQRTRPDQPFCQACEESTAEAPVVALWRGGTA